MRRALDLTFIAAPRRLVYYRAMGNATRYFLYARKSSEAEDRQVRSIEAQLSELRQMVERDRLIVVQEFKEEQSAKTPGRPIFNEMLARIEAGEADGILAWHADRLARNSLDGGRVIFLLDTGKLRRLQFFGGYCENTPQGKMMLSVEFGFSKYYVDSLSENVKRGHRNKIARGEYPGLAPLGYQNDPRLKRIVVDRDRAPVVRRAFELYATGSETLESIAKHFAAHSIVTRRTKKGEGKRPLNRNSVSKILTNPLYYGHFRYNGEIHEGNHEPLVTKKLFDDVHAVFEERFRYSIATVERQPKPLTRLFRCGECGCSITAEVQKGHTYYRCSKKRKDRHCFQPFVREEALDVQLSEMLAQYAPGNQWADEMLAMLETETIGAANASAVLLVEHRASAERLNARLQRLKEGYLDALIEGDDFRNEKAAILSERKTLTEKIDALTNDNNRWLEPFREWISDAQRVGAVAEHGSPEEKRALAKKVFGSNLFLTDRKARGEAVEPWSLLSGGYTGLTTAERGRFELPRSFRPCQFSKLVHSTTLPPLQGLPVYSAPILALFAEMAKTRRRWPSIRVPFCR